MALLATIRFNDLTWGENIAYREAKKMQGCIYGLRLRVKEQILLYTPMLVVEMNNDKNQLEGIGLIRNFIATDKYYKVYENSDFNRYIYKSEYRVSREELMELNSDLVECIETLCFKGKTHQKRLPGITVMSEKLLATLGTTNGKMTEQIKEIFTLKYRGETFLD
jgi:hypothetical protein